VILNVIVQGMDIQAAVLAPRFHSQWYPDTIQFERFALAADTIAALEDMGHTVVPRGDIIGTAHCIAFRIRRALRGPDHRMSRDSIVATDRLRVDSLRQCTDQASGRRSLHPAKGESSTCHRGD